MHLSVLIAGLAAVGAPVFGVNVGAQPHDREHYANLKAELTISLQHRFRTGRLALHPVFSDSTLAREGSTLKVGYSVGGKIVIEGKEQYRRRTGKSPDLWDALVLAMDDTAGLPLMDFD